MGEETKVHYLADLIVAASGIPRDRIEGLEVRLGEREQVYVLKTRGGERKEFRYSVEDRHVRLKKYKAMRIEKEKIPASLGIEYRIVDEEALEADLGRELYG